MPVLKASIKSAKQSEVRRIRRQPGRTSMKTAIRKVQDLAKSGKKDEVAKALSAAYKTIDMAVKKNMIHWKNGARKKSLLARMVGGKKK